MTDPAPASLDLAPPLDLEGTLRAAHAAGLIAIVGPDQAGELADLVGFAKWARHELYPLQQKLAPILETIFAAGPELADMTNMQRTAAILGLLKGL